MADTNRNDAYGLTKENFLRALPSVLQTGEQAHALASVAAETLEQLFAETDQARLYPELDRIGQDLLDMLAYDFKVDWWDADYTPEQKLRTLRGAWEVHRHLGTKAAVETALGAVFPGTVVREWFEYGGEPYTFRVEVPLSETGVTVEQQQRVLERVRYYKNLRSHLEGVDLQTEQEKNVRLGACTVQTACVEIWPEPVSRVEVSGAVGASVGNAARQKVEVWPE